MKNQTLFLWLSIWTALFLFVDQVDSRPTVTRVKVRPREDGLVEIAYDVEAKSPLAVTVRVSNDSGVSYKVPVQLSSLAGDVGDSVKPGDGKKILLQLARNKKSLAFVNQKLIDAYKSRSIIPLSLKKLM